VRSTYFKYSSGMPKENHASSGRPKENSAKSQVSMASSGIEIMGTAEICHTPYCLSNGSKNLLNL